MNPNIDKLREELAKNKAKIAKLTERNEQIEHKLTELENTNIVGMVRASGMNLEQLAALFATLKESPIPHPETLEQEVSKSEAE